MFFGSPTNSSSRTIEFPPSFFLYSKSVVESKTAHRAMSHRSAQHVVQQLRWMGGVTRELILAMGIGVKWLTMTLRIILFGALVAPLFLTTILWYVLSPNIIRRVAYRTSKATRARHLRSLLRRARRVVSKQLHHEETQPLGTGASSTQQDERSSHDGGEDSTATWSRMATTFFHTPQRSKRAVNAPTMSTNPSYDLLHDTKATTSGALFEDGKEAPQTPSYAFEQHASSRGVSGTPVTIPTTDSDDDSEDSESPHDQEDVRNLHNRATLDIYLPCPLDELLRVQHRLQEGRDVHESNSPIATPHTNGRRSTSFGLNKEPSLIAKKYPIVICVAGGAWIIGSHLWSALLARVLSGRGCVVFCPDYRNFPQSNMAEMTRDVSDAIAWVLRNAERYNGDLSNVTLIGQSAGAHLSWMSLISQARLAADQKAKADASDVSVTHSTTRGCATEDFGATVCNLTMTNVLSGTLDGAPYGGDEISLGVDDAHQRSLAPPSSVDVAPSESLLELHAQRLQDARPSAGSNGAVYLIPRFNPRRSIHRFIPLSGIYDLPHLIRHFHRRGLYRKVLYRIAGGKERLRSEFCVNRYFEAGDVPPPQAPLESTEGRDSPMFHSTTKEPTGTNFLLNRSMLPAELHRAILREGCEENGWVVDQLLMNESFLLDATVRRRGTVATAAPKSSNGASPFQFLEELPRRIVFLHGDCDMSAPISEPLRLYQKIQDALHVHRAKSASAPAVDVSVVCIEGGTHTNVIVEELLSGNGKSVVASFVAQEVGLPTSEGKERGARKRRGASAPPLEPPAGPQPSAVATSPHYRVIPMEVRPNEQSIVLRLAALVCPF